MKTILMRVEGHETDIPTAGDAQPLGHPLPRGVPVQKVYSKRLGEAGFKTDDKGNMSYTPGKPVVDAVNGYTPAKPSTGVWEAQYLNEGHGWTAAPEVPVMANGALRVGSRTSLGEAVEMLNNILTESEMLVKDHPFKVGDRVKRAGWKRSYTVSKFTQNGVCFEGYGNAEFSLGDSKDGPLLKDTALQVGDRVARPNWTTSYIVTEVLPEGVRVRGCGQGIQVFTNNLGTIVHDSTKPLYNGPERQ